MISKLEDFDYTMEQSEEGYKNFTVIKCKIKSIEWLYLAAKGHRRAKFDLENAKDTWLIPQMITGYIFTAFLKQKYFFHLDIFLSLSLVIALPAENV